MKAAILGAGGYAGMTLLRLLDNHPQISKIFAASSTKIGEKICKYDAGFFAEKSKTEDVFFSVEQAAELKPDIVFSCLPHLTSAEVCERFIGKTVVIDLSADFRLEKREDFIASYGKEPPKPQYQSQAVYGLPEIYRGDIRKSDLIANPGCYPTAALLPLAPFLGLAGDGEIVVDALSGVSGAGRKLNENYLFCSREENMGAYLPGKEHRHTREIEKEILKIGGSERELFFTPHLVPVIAGMTATIQLNLNEKIDEEKAIGLIDDYYSDSPFIRNRGRDIPQSADTRGTNRCDIGCRVFGRRLMLFSSIDNLVRGASGMAAQNMNIRFGFEETAGLPVHGQI